MYIQYSSLVLLQETYQNNHKTFVIIIQKWYAILSFEPIILWKHTSLKHTSRQCNNQNEELRKNWPMEYDLLYQVFV